VTDLQQIGGIVSEASALETNRKRFFFVGPHNALHDRKKDMHACRQSKNAQTPHLQFRAILFETKDADHNESHIVPSHGTSDFEAMNSTWFAE